METSKIVKLINSCSQVKICYFNEEIYCQILKISDTLIMIKDIKDWHYDAFMIIPRKYIKKIKRNKREKCIEKILPPLQKEQFLIETKKINLNSIKDVLKSLYSINQGLCIENATNKEYSFYLGKIKKIKDTHLKFKPINVCGKYKKKNIKINYKNITCIFYKDEYSTRIIEYADRNLREIGAR